MVQGTGEGEVLGSSLLPSILGPLREKREKTTSLRGCVFGQQMPCGQGAVRAADGDSQISPLFMVTGSIHCEWFSQRVVLVQCSG